MTAPVRAPSPPLRAPSRAATPSPAGDGGPAAAPATHPRAGAAAPNRHRGPAAAPPAPGARPPLRLVEDRRQDLDARRRRARLALVGAGVLLVGLLFGVVVCHAMLVTGQGRLDTLQAEVAEEQARYQALRLQVAELEAPSRIVDEAQGRLGMVSPEEITYLTPVPLDDDGAGGAGAAPQTAASAPWTAVKPLLEGDR